MNPTEITIKITFGPDGKVVSEGENVVAGEAAAVSLDEAPAPEPIEDIEAEEAAETGEGPPPDEELGAVAADDVDEDDAPAPMMELTEFAGDLEMEAAPGPTEEPSAGLDDSEFPYLADEEDAPSPMDDMLGEEFGEEGMDIDDAPSPLDDDTAIPMDIEDEGPEPEPEPEPPPET